jgi:hypothetical protein
MLKLLKYLLLSTLTLLILSIAIAYVVAVVYEKEIVASVVSELNEQVETKINIKSVNFSLLKSFPLASVQFEDVFMSSTADYLKSNPKEDTLLFAKDIYLEFSLLDVINEKYLVKQLRLIDAKVYMRVDKNGKDNFHIAKAKSDTSTAKLSLDLNKVVLNKVNYQFNNKQARNRFGLYAKQFALKGNFSDDEFGLSTSGTLLLNEIVLNDIKYLMYPNTALNTDLLVNQSKVEIKKGSLKIGDEYLDLKGSYWFDNQSYIDIEAKSDQMTINNILSNLPEEQAKMLDHYEAKGRVAFELSVKGDISKNKTPKIELNAFVNDAELLHTVSQIPLKQLSFNAHYISVGNILEIRGFKGQLFESSAKGQFMIKNFKQPYISADFELQSHLSELKQFFELDSLQQLDGLVKANLSINGKINDLDNINKADLRTFKTRGHISVENAKISVLGDHAQQFQSIKAELTLDDNNVEIDSLSFSFNESNVKLKGKAYNALAYLFLDEEIRLNGDLSCDTLYLGTFLSDNENKAQEPSEAFQYPTRLVARVTLAIDHLIYDKFKAEKVYASVYINQEQLNVSEFRIETCSGKAYGELNLYPLANKNYTLNLNSKLEQIQMSDLMYQMDDFGQTSINYKNIDGKLGAITKLSAQLDPFFNIIKSTLEVNSNFLIADGELKNYEPMYKLSKFVELSDLEDVKFDQIQNVLEIKNSILYLPQMLISSNAINLKLSGEHSFENRYQYKLNILLSEILGKKARKNKPQNEEFAFVEDDGRGRTSLFILIEGLGDDMKIKYDSKSVKAHIKEGFIEEKQSMKSLLKEEFGLFKNDTTIKTKPQETKSSKEQFQIEWEDE